MNPQPPVTRTRRVVDIHLPYGPPFQGGSLILLRILGLVVAVILLVLVVSRFRRRSLTLGDALIMGSVALGLTVVAIVPSAIDPLLTELGFPPGDERRVIGVLVLSNILLFVLLFRSFAKTDQLEHRLGDYADRIASRMFATAYEPEGSGKAVIVIPAFNEESSLPQVMAAMPKKLHGLDVETIVVSDGSDDATEEVAHQYGALVVGRDLRRGQGAAVRLGYRVALARGPSVVATVDSDGQYDPLELPQLVAPILAGEADVVHGSRSLGSYETPDRRPFARGQVLRVADDTDHRHADHRPRQRLPCVRAGRAARARVAREPVPRQRGHDRRREARAARTRGALHVP